MKNILSLFFLSLMCLFLSAQNVGVGTSSPAAKLDVTSTNSGVLIPRIALTGSHDSTTVPLPVTSLLVYNTATVPDSAGIAPGFYYWSGSAWVRLIDNGGSVIDTVINFTTGNILRTIVNYTSSRGAPIINTNAISLSGSSLTTTVNGIASTPVDISAIDKNIYNSDGSLTSNRTVTMGANNLNFNSTSGDMTFTSTSGNAGIGTSVPLYKMHVIPAGSADGLMIQNNAGNPGTMANIFLATYADISGSHPGARISAIDNNFSADITLSTKVPGADANALAERMRITNSGYVGIGTASPAANLDVAGNTRTTNLQMTNGATAGYILQSDAGGSGSWISPASIIPATTNALTLSGSSLTSTVNGVSSAAIDISPVTATSWTTTGNGNIVDGTNFLGTTTNVPLLIRVNNLKAGKLDATLFNSFWGVGAAHGASTGAGNTATGYNALNRLSTGDSNTAVGYNALQGTLTGNYNTAVGAGAFMSNGSGSYNTALGYNANIAVGSGPYINTTIIGANAEVTQNNSLILGSIAGVNGATASVNVGIGTTAPGATLDVIGTTRTTNLQMTSGAAAGYILQSDAAGNASWTPPAPGTNIYNTDGSLTRSRTVTIPPNESLNFAGGGPSAIFNIAGGGFQVSAASGEIKAANGITASNTIKFTSLSSGGTNVVYADPSGVLQLQPAPSSHTDLVFASTQYFIVPYGVTTLNVQLWGAGGTTNGGNYNTTYTNYKNSGGAGGYVKGTLNVTPGEALTLVIGSTTSGGGGKGNSLQRNFNSNVNFQGGDGGGRTAIVRGTADLVTAGGGGGAGGDSLGYGGGGGGGGSSAPFQDNARVNSHGGNGGVAGHCFGQDGSRYRGGDGDTMNAGPIDAGGGGGGYTGGGGGGSAYGYMNCGTIPGCSSGGGGSSYTGGLVTLGPNRQGDQGAGINSINYVANNSSLPADYINKIGFGGYWTLTTDPATGQQQISENLPGPGLIVISW